MANYKRELFCRLYIFSRSSFCVERAQARGNILCQIDQLLGGATRFALFSPYVLNQDITITLPEPHNSIYNVEVAFSTEIGSGRHRISIEGIDAISLNRMVGQKHLDPI